ncbi:acyl-CoA dehydrogenase family protein [Amycolatopsis jiangsuensis]|uniref:Alkylation response protein AidB-like acyl-CoA dehydrogenase n=1 Tax=Amycolatopsis jiangsuensis TaxID=1181879 RepID=A0A840INJ1_9PSEU|nr:acyl-CoA dehydrogenase family protein [Amycolatopsis jiangsuensis]MBB4683936.1 alkylation response protein AidB-like acyl-CoA dehydrogenase [Amycolatopsis jiangsuensis]
MTAELVSAGHTVAGIRTAITPVLARLAAGSAERERTREYAFAEVRDLAAHRIGLLGVPVEDGGAGGSLRDVAELVTALARADSNVAQALRPTFLVAERVRRPGFPHRERTLRRLNAGDLFAGSGNERTGGASGSVNATLRRAGDGYVVNGEKYYSTGGLYATWFSTSATDEDGTVVGFTVPFDREGVHRLDDFDAVGQRLTASGTTRLVDVRVHADELTPHDVPPAAPWRGSFAQLYLASVEAGIAAAALDDAVRFVRAKARPIKHSTATRSVDDPYVRETVGRIGASAQAARSAVLLAAEVLDAARDGDRVAAAEAAVTVAQTGVIAIESAFRAAELLFDVGGGSATDRALGFDRHWRNARTVANHNPRQWKAAVAGAFHLTGEDPPTTGLF